MIEIKLKPGKEKALNNLHPWVFSGALAKLPKNLAVGSLVKIIAHDNKPLALGHYCGDAGIVIRICSFYPDLILDKNFWYQKFDSALNLRKSLCLINSQTNAFRFLHGEGDGLSGLVCDIFGDSASINLTNIGLEPVLDYLNKYLQDNLNIKNIYFDNQKGEADFLENNLSFKAHIGDGQKTGHFLDQRDNRALVKKYAKARRVLDTFCYSGGFSIYALAGQAQSVISVDISQAAINLVNYHVELNNLNNNHKALTRDCFDYLREVAPGDVDMIILDPPAFAKSKNAVERAARGYKDINLQALKILDKNSLLFTFSCSQHMSPELFKKIIFAAAKDSKRNVKIIHELTQAPDHPVSVYCPQSSYLKGLVLYVE